MNSAHKTRPLVAEKVREASSAKFRRKLPHQIGQVFTNTILSCLMFEEHTNDMVAYERHRYYEMHVVDRMAEAVDKVLEFDAISFTQGFSDLSCR